MQTSLVVLATCSLLFILHIAKVRRVRVVQQLRSTRPDRLRAGSKSFCREKSAQETTSLSSPNTQMVVMWFLLFQSDRHHRKSCIR